MWLKQDLPRILIDSLEPCHFHQLNGFRRPLPYFGHMLWPGSSAPWLKHLSCIYDLQGSVMPLNILYINWMILSRIFLKFLWQIHPPLLPSGVIDVFIVIVESISKHQLIINFVSIIKTFLTMLLQSFKWKEPFGSNCLFFLPAFLLPLKTIQILSGHWNQFYCLS